MSSKQQKPKLVKDTKVVKLPRHTGSVQATFRRAMDKAQKQGWSRVVILGEGAKRGGSYWSAMLDTTVLGMLEKGKRSVFDAFDEDDY